MGLHSLNSTLSPYYIVIVLKRKKKKVEKCLSQIQRPTLYDVETDYTQEIEFQISVESQPSLVPLPHFQLSQPCKPVALSVWDPASQKRDGARLAPG